MNNNILGKSVPLSNVIFVIVILFLLIGDIFFIYKCSSLQAEANRNELALQGQETNGKVLEFTKLFVSRVLKSDTEIDFETRLKLENAVRDLDDQEILAQWQKFIDSKTEQEAQVEVKGLLEMLVGKIK